MEAVAILILSEIMYNPASSEREPVEWVELYNPTARQVDLAGWYLADEDGRTDAIAKGTTLAPKQALVLIPAAQSAEKFRQAWGEDCKVVPVKNWQRLANSPSPQNEKLALHRPDQSAADTVNYDDAGDWPSDTPEGASIYVLPAHLSASANDDGAHWARSEAGKHGARHATAGAGYDSEDVGSPGTVVATGDAPADPGQPEPSE